MEGLREICKQLAKSGAIPSAKHLTRSSHTLPATVLNQVGFGVGLQLQETSHPKWAGKKLTITRIQPELVHI